MRHALFGLLGASALVLASACGGDDDRPPASLEGKSGSSTNTAGKSSRGGSGSQSDAGAGPVEDGGAGGAPGGAGAPGIDYETAGAPTQIPGLCDPAMMPGEDTAQELESAAATLLGMTPDERSIVFVTGDAPSLALHVADRSSSEGAFEPLEVPLPAGYVASHGATLSSDGLTLVLVLADGSGFGAITRAARGEAFSTEADETAFSRLNAQKPMSGRSLGWPVLSSDGGTLYFVSAFGHAVVVQSTRAADGRFDLGTEIDEFTLGGAEGAYKRINAVSADQRAIFFFDEATEHSGALFRSRPGAPFYEPVDLGARFGVAPNADCTRLYSSVAGQLVAQAVD